MTTSELLGAAAHAAPSGDGAPSGPTDLRVGPEALRPLGVDECLLDQIVRSLHPEAPPVFAPLAASLTPASAGAGEVLPAALPGAAVPAPVIFAPPAKRVPAMPGIAPSAVAIAPSGLDPNALAPPRSLPSPTVYALDGGLPPLLPENAVPASVVPTPITGFYFLPAESGELAQIARPLTPPAAALPSLTTPTATSPSPGGLSVPRPSLSAAALPSGGQAIAPVALPSGDALTAALSPPTHIAALALPTGPVEYAATPYFLPSTPPASTSLPTTSWPAAPVDAEATTAGPPFLAPLVTARPGAGDSAGLLPHPVPAPSAQKVASLDWALPRPPADGAAPAPQPTVPAQALHAVPAAPGAAEAPRPSETRLSHEPFDVIAVRRDFPILQERVHGRPLVWLDNAATTQKPRAVIDRLVQYYEHEYSNVHRGAHTLAARSTDAYENARETVARFLGAATPREIVFVRGTTEAVNLVANSWGRRFLTEGDEIVLTTLEHHSNIVPWQFLAETHGVVLRVVPVTDRGEVLLSDFSKTLSPRTRFVSITHVSNALGTVLPVGEMIQVAHRHGARVLVDGAQAVSHFAVNVQAIDADFYTLSSHKLFGPSAAGVLYGKLALLDEMPPWQGGGNMIERVTFERSSFMPPPMRFEAGTATLAPAIGLGAAIEYLERIGMPNITRHEHELLQHATEALSAIRGVRLIGTAPEKAGVVSFLADGIGVEEMGGILDQEGIAVRAGHHCAQPTMDRFGLTGTVRPSFALYNTHEEVELLARTVRQAIQQRR
jgi:cysteine desulfurase/selenocysteine lyase